MVTQPNLDQLVSTYLQLAAKAAEVAEAMDAVKAQIRDLDLGHGKHPTGSGVVSISANRRFNPDLARQVLTTINPALIPACEKTVIDSALAKRLLPPATYEACMKSSDNDRLEISHVTSPKQ